MFKTVCVQYFEHFIRNQFAREKFFKWQLKFRSLGRSKIAEHFPGNERRKVQTSKAISSKRDAKKKKRANR
ncbi:hypothetical protein PUN28_014848 [Cardiocondyla obscurior]|uniref:Uncharacterized protein n=1 Tax=Cardiocondyla obscurior TaxID=286306 RepID=A0AAW2EVT5_9HYME